MTLKGRWLLWKPYIQWFFKTKKQKEKWIERFEKNLREEHPEEWKYVDGFCGEEDDR